MPKRYLKNTKQNVRNLRSTGWSLGEISQKMAIPKNTISGWVKDIRLTKSQIKRIKQKEIDSAVIGRTLATKLLREKMEKWKEGIREKVKYLGKFPLKNPEIGKIVCGLLYSCEGAKYPSTRGLIFTNSDPDMIRCFLYLLKKHFHISANKLRIRIMYRWDQDIGKLKRYWSNITRIPLSQFFNSKPDKRTKGIATKQVNYKGVCAIQYSDVSIQFELQSIGEAIINKKWS